MSYLTLPQDKPTLAESLRQVIAQGVRDRNIHRVEWLVNRYYMEGARSFTGLNYGAGTVSLRYQNTKGELNYRYEEATRLFQNELGRLMRMDITPKVARDKNFSLDGLRNSATAQAVLNILHLETNSDEVKMGFLLNLLMYGTSGLACWGQSRAKLERPKTVLEVVPPWELLPVPSCPATLGDVRAIVRLRWLPLESLKKMEGLNFKGFEEGEVKSVRIGQHPEQLGTTSPLDAPLMGDEQKSASVEADEDKMLVKYVQTAEVFVPEDDGVLSRFVVWAGGNIILDEDYSGEEEPPLMPLGIARYVQGGGFYGKSFLSLILPTNMEVEFLMRRLFENAQDLDQFGFLCLPLGMGINTQQLKSTTRPRFIHYQPDLTIPEHKPFALQPVNTGDWPWKVAQMGRVVMKDIAGQSELLQGNAPGRVDSAQALGFLQETSNIPLSATAQSIVSAYKAVYRAMLGMAREKWQDESLARLTMLDDTIIGVRIDAATGQLQLDKKAIPYPTEVEVSVAAAQPPMMQQRKNELVMMLQAQIITPREFRRINMVEGLGFPTGNRAEFENYRKGILNNIILFGDGEKPGPVAVSGITDNAEIQLEVLMDFMARPEFNLASKEVRDAFIERRQMYLDELGRKFPEALSHPEDMAEMAELTGGPTGRPTEPPGTGGEAM